MRWLLVALAVLSATWSALISTLPASAEPHMVVSLLAFPTCFLLVLLAFRRRGASAWRSFAQHLSLVVLFTGGWALIYVLFLGHPAIRATLLVLASGAGALLGSRFLRREGSYAEA
jgi:hypothetical protein